MVVAVPLGLTGKEERKLKITCIALDLDGTTLTPPGRLSRKPREAIEKALEAGIQVVAASGRSLDSLPEDILAISGIQYGITSNGAAVYRLSDRKCLKQCKLTKESVREILKYTEGQETAFEAFIEGKPYAQKEYVEDPVRFGATQRAIPYIQSTREPIEDMTKFIYDHQEILDCLDIVVKSEEKKRKLWKTLQENVKDVYITSSVIQLLEISHRDSGKEAGIRFLLEYLGLKREGLAAFGDGDNDREMISYARVGVAMGNASPECKKAADWIAPSNEEDGVAWGIEKLLEENRSGL